MELYIYDAEMNMLGIVEQITSLIWTRRYWDCGEFKLLVPFNDAHNRLLQAENIVILRAMRLLKYRVNFC